VSSAGPQDHVVLFYDNDDELVDTVTEHLHGAIRVGGVAIMVATYGHRVAVEARLEQQGVDLARSIALGSYVAFDADEVMARFMINEYADPAGFWQVISPVLKRAGRRRRPVAIFGEMVGLLWDRDRASAAVELEALWNEMASHYVFSMLCGYPAAVLQDEMHEVFAAHSAVAGSQAEPDDIAAH
jgi:MEDS: MEthanogen/methylotroph, DcmR Sensory domain